MRIVALLILSMLCAEVYAGDCPGGRCNVSSRNRTVVKSSPRVDSVRVIDSVRVVTPVNRSRCGRCANGKCNIR